MKVCVNDNCIGCGSCVGLTDSKIFDFNDEGLAECIVDHIDKEDEEITHQAMEYCPVSAISEVSSDK